MKYEDLVEEFNKIVVYFSWEPNDESTRSEIVLKFTELIHRLRDEGYFNYTLMKNFIDVSTPEIIDRGGFEIKVELVNGEIITISEYCEVLTNREKYADLLKKSINYIFDNYKK